MARSGDGVDIAAVYQFLVGMSGRLDEVVVRLNGHTQKLDDLAIGLSDLRAAVTNYHGAVLGHGVMLSELDERVRRIERHLKLESAHK